MRPLALTWTKGATADGAGTCKITMIPGPSEGSLGYMSSRLNSLNTAKNYA